MGKREGRQREERGKYIGKTKREKREEMAARG